MENKPYILTELNKIGKSEIGYISFLQGKSDEIPFEIKRVYWTYFTPNEVLRGGHAHKKLNQVIFAVSGIITFTTEDLQGNKETFVLDTPNKGLFLPEKYWRDIQFSHNAVLLCLASEVYTAEDYIRDYDEFKKLGL